MAINVLKVGSSVAKLLGGLFGGGGQAKLDDTRVTEALNAKLRRNDTELQASTSCDSVLFRNRIEELEGFRQLGRLKKDGGALQRSQSLQNFTYTTWIPRQIGQFQELLASCGQTGSGSFVGGVAESLGVEQATARTLAFGVGGLVVAVIVGAVLFKILQG